MHSCIKIVNAKWSEHERACKAQEAIMLMYELTTFVWNWDFIASDIQIDIGYYNRFNG